MFCDKLGLNTDCSLLNSQQSFKHRKKRWDSRWVYSSQIIHWYYQKIITWPISTIMYRKITIIHTSWPHSCSILLLQFLSKYRKSKDQLHLYSNHTSSDNRVWYHLYLYEELPGCSAAKTFKLRAFLVRRRCLPNSQRTQALKSITIRKHIHWSRGFPYGKKS